MSKWAEMMTEVTKEYLTDENNELDHLVEIGKTIHLTNSDIMRLAKQIENCFTKIDEYARRIESSDHPLRDDIIEALYGEQIFYTVDVVDIVRGVLKNEQ